MVKVVKQYGSWDSVISAESLSQDLRISDVQYDIHSDTLVWREERSGKGVLVARQGETASRDVTDTLSVRAQVGYGGGDFTVLYGIVYFVAQDGRLYKQALSGGDSMPITPEFGSAASPKVSPDGKYVVYVHSYEKKDVLAIAEEGKWPRKLFDKTDFVMQPSWHPDSQSLAFITWNHPHMPWDSTELRVIDLEGKDEIISKEEDKAFFQPEFSSDGTLYYVGDDGDFSQIFSEKKKITDYPAEHKIPAWIQGMRTYCLDGKKIYFIRHEKGVDTLWCYSEGKQEQVDLGSYVTLGQLTKSKNGVVGLASAPNIPARIVEFPSQKIIKRTSTEKYMSVLEDGVTPITWKGHDGEDVHGIYYPPESQQYTGEGAPPLIVHVHGGPTSHVKMAYNNTMRFFSTRGFACLQVNYRGSTGYGKKYMQKLYGNWGIYDVEDSASGAMHLVEQGLADKDRLVIMGGSAGGFTVLQSLVEKAGFYKAAVCSYGVSNHLTFIGITHKFEQYYLETLLGEFPKYADVYKERSPYFHADKITDSIVVFQGAEDKVVPQSQSDIIVKSLQQRGIAHEYHLYEGEGHGWRKSETIQHYHENIIKFLDQQVLYN
jgi:dipeptidyl aminopeptidase/acylaminoacyl peptidase